MGIPLDKFISNLENIRDTGLVKICEQEIKDIFFEVLYEMAKLTIVDTGQARSAIIDDFSTEYGYNVADLYTEFYGFWEDAFKIDDEPLRNWGAADVNYIDKFEGRKASVFLDIADDGLYAQENAIDNEYEGSEYPSSFHKRFTGRDNSKYEINHITKVSDEWVNYPEVQLLFKKMKDRIVERLFRK